MCVQASHPEIENVFMDFLNSSKQFTAYDVTKEVRNCVGHSVRIDHDDVRAYVHGNFRDLSGVVPTDYSRQIIHLSIGSSQYLYFPVSSDPNDYINAHGGQPIQSQLTGVVPSADDGLDLNDDDEEDEDSIGLLKTVTSENRVNIPLKALNQVTLESGSYDIEANGGIKCVAPNSDGRVRVTVSYNVGDKVTVTSDTSRNCIVVNKYVG